MDKMPDSSFPSIDVYSPYEMAKRIETAMALKVQKPFSISFLSSIFGGFFIAMAFLFYTVVTTGSSAMPYGMAKLVGGLCFSMGLILVVLCGVNLFTSTTMTLVAKMSKKITWWDLIQDWARVYLGNFVGALLLILIIYMSQQSWGNQGNIALNYMNIAQSKINYNFLQAVALGIMCNVMVCLGVWSTYSGRSTTDIILALVFPVTMFVACGFEHCVANMYEIPMGIILYHSASPDFWATQHIDIMKYADLTWANFFLKNLLPVTIGNIIGGSILIGAGNWLLFLRPSIQHIYQKH